MIDLIFIGAGSFPETVYIIDAINSVRPKYRVIGLLDDNPDLQGREVNGVPVLGGIDKANAFKDETKFVFGIGSHRNHLLRASIFKKIGLKDERYETIVHPGADVFGGVKLGFGCIIHPRVVLGQDSVLEGFNVVFPNSVVASRNFLGKFTLITSLVSLTDRVHIGPCSFIGTSTCIAEAVKIGAGAMVAMGSVVYKDVPDGVFAMGSPLKFLNKKELPSDVVELILSR